MKKILLLVLLSLLIFSCSDTVNFSPISGNFDSPVLGNEEVGFKMSFASLNPNRALNQEDIKNNNNTYQLLLYNDYVFYHAAVDEFVDPSLTIEMDVIVGEYTMIVLVGQKIAAGDPSALLAVGKKEIIIVEDSEQSIFVSGITYNLSGFEGDKEQNKDYAVSLGYDLLATEIIGNQDMIIERDSSFDLGGGWPVLPMGKSEVQVNTVAVPASSMTLSGTVPGVFYTNIDTFKLKGENEHIAFSTEDYNFIFDGSYFGKVPGGVLSEATDVWVMPTHDNVDTDVFTMMQENVSYTWTTGTVTVTPEWGD